MNTKQRTQIATTLRAVANELTAATPEGDFESAEEVFQVVKSIQDLANPPSVEQMKKAVAPKDQVFVATLLGALGHISRNRWGSRPVPAHPNSHGADFSQIRNVAGSRLTSPRIRALFVKYGHVFAEAVGAKTVEVVAASYSSSGRGAFGRLKGGDKGTYNEARVRFTN